MLMVVEISKFHKIFRVIGVFVEKKRFCLTLLWYYNERYDSGKGLFRFQIGQFIEYRGKRGVKIEVLRFSWVWFRKEKVMSKPEYIQGTPWWNETEKKAGEELAGEQNDTTGKIIIEAVVGAT